MTLQTVTEYQRHKGPRICSTCRPHFLVLSSFIHHRVCNYSNTTRRVPLVEQGTAYPSGAPAFTPIFNYVPVAQFCVVLCRLLFILLSLFFWLLCCLLFFDLWILITFWYLQTLLDTELTTTHSIAKCFYVLKMCGIQHAS